MRVFVSVRVSVRVLVLVSVCGRSVCDMSVQQKDEDGGVRYECVAGVGKEGYLRVMQVRVGLEAP